MWLDLKTGDGQRGGTLRGLEKRVKGAEDGLALQASVAKAEARDSSMCIE